MPPRRDVDAETVEYYAGPRTSMKRMMERYCFLHKDYEPPTLAELQAKALRNQGTITRAKLLVILYPSISQSIYTYFTHNTQRVINTAKPKLLSVS